MIGKIMNQEREGSTDKPPRDCVCVFLLFILLARRYLGTSASLTMDQCVRMGISALQNVLSEDFKASQIEVGIVKTRWANNTPFATLFTPTPPLCSFL